MSQRSATGATLSGIAHRFRRREPIGELADNVRIDGKTCLVTGANSGLGKAIAMELARRGGRIIMAGRTHDEEARDAIRSVATGAEAELEHLDLADLASVYDFASRMTDRKLDITVLNAGIVPRNARRTIDGLEEGFQVNFLANVLLVNELLATGAIGRGTGARIVVVSSESHRSAAPIDFSQLATFRDYGVSDAVREYGRTKLLSCTWSAELERRLGDEVAVHTLCPGAVNTNLAREAPAWSQPLLKVAFALFFRAPELAAEPVVYLACAPELENRTGLYLHVMEEKPMAPLAIDADNGARLWRECEQLLDSLNPAARSRGSDTTPANRDR